jgi:amino-acid N-acetyltransferase
MLRLADLREMLRYVPHYRDRIFVIAIDGAIVECDNFRNLLLDIALLRSLRIGVALVHGAGHQIRRLAEAAGLMPSNLDGTGITDLPTLRLALTAATGVTHEILEGLSANDLRGACSNALVAHPAGILQGIDQQWTGRVERVDIAFLRSLLQNDIIPVIPPLGCDGEGNSYRLNSDAVAVEVAKALEAVKLIYLTNNAGILIRPAAGSEPNVSLGSGERGEREPAEELLRQLTVDEADAILKRQRYDLSPASVSKLMNAVKAGQGGVPRIHIIDGRVEEGLLGEVFSNEGIGTLVHTNLYQAIRQARKRDARGINALIRSGVESEELLPRSMAEIDRQINDFYVFEVDGSLAGCVALHQHPGDGKAELACVCVSAKYENQGIGLRLMSFVEELARERGLHQLFCLSTQAVNYFLQKGGFRLGTPEDLPSPRRQRYDFSGRRSQVLIKDLDGMPLPVR